MNPSQTVWLPTAEYVERARISRFMRAFGLASLADLQRRSIEDPEWYWDAVARDLGIRWIRPYQRVLDASRGIAWPRWFEGGLLNFCDNCLERHVEVGRGAQPALLGRVMEVRSVRSPTASSQRK